MMPKAMIFSSEFHLPLSWALEFREREYKNQLFYWFMSMSNNFPLLFPFLTFTFNIYLQLSMKWCEIYYMRNDKVRNWKVTSTSFLIYWLICYVLQLKFSLFHKKFMEFLINFVRILWLCCYNQNNSDS